MDTIIVHGGLGTTAVALRAGVPTIVTGLSASSKISEFDPHI